MDVYVCCLVRPFFLLFAKSLAFTAWMHMPIWIVSSFCFRVTYLRYSICCRRKIPILKKKSTSTAFAEVTPATWESDVTASVGTTFFVALVLIVYSFEFNQTLPCPLVRSIDSIQ